jgi:hypothetical protein
VNFAFLLDPRLSQEPLRPVLGLDSPCPVSAAYSCIIPRVLFNIFSLSRFVCTLFLETATFLYVSPFRDIALFAHTRCAFVLAIHRKARSSCLLLLLLALTLCAGTIHRTAFTLLVCGLAGSNYLFRAILNSLL